MMNSGQSERMLEAQLAEDLLNHHSGHRLVGFVFYAEMHSPFSDSRTIPSNRAIAPHPGTTRDSICRGLCLIWISIFILPKPAG